MAIVNTTDDIQVKGSSRADEIENYAPNVSIDAGAGNDTITNEDGDYTLIEAKDGNDSIYAADNDYVTADGGSGNDTISGVFFSSEIKGASGNDVVNVELANDSTIDGGDGTDSISGVFVGSSINGGTGNDLITLQMNYEGESEDNTVSGGKGNDTIINEVANEYEDPEDIPGNVYVYSNGDGNDVIEGFGSNDTLKIASGTISDSVMDDEGNLVITIGTGTVKITGLAEGQTMWLQEGNKDALEVTVGCEPPNPIEDDYIELTSGKDDYENSRDNVTIAALAGNDTVYNDGYAVSINGGAGNDVITNDGDDVTVTGGAGADTITNSGDGFVYEYEGGKDVFTQYNGENILIDAEDYTAEVSGDNWVIKVNNSTSNTITIKDAADQSIFVNGEEIEPPLPTPEGWKFTGGKAVASIASADKELDLNKYYGEGITTVDGAKITTGVSIVGNDNGNSIRGGKGADTIIGGTGDDSVSLGAGADLYIYKGGEDIIQDYAAGDTVQVIIEDISDISAETVGSNVEITTSAGTITLNKAAGKEIVLIDEAGDIIPLSSTPDGWKFASGKATASISSAAKEVDLTEHYGDDITKVDATKITTGVSIVSNNLDVSIKSTKGNDTIISGTGNATVSLGAGNDLYVYNGGNDIIQDYEAGDIVQINLSNPENITAEVSNTDVILTVDDGTITLKKAKDKEITLIDDVGNIIDITGGPAVINGTSKADTLTNSDTNEKGTVIDGLGGNDKINNSGDYVSIYGGAGNDSIVNSGDSVLIEGGKGADTIYNEGEGNTFVYNYGDGKDVITGFGESDTLIIDKEYTYDVSGDDLKITVGSGTTNVITLKDAASKEIHVNDEIIKIEAPLPEGWVYGNKQKTFVKASLVSAETEIDINEPYGEGVVSVDGSKITGGVNIIGNDENNSLNGGKGADTIFGGNGNDTVSLGAGEDVYVYTDGEDVISDYAVGDKIKFIGIGANDFTTSVVKSDVVFSITNGGTLTVKNGNKVKEIVIIDEKENVIYPSEPPLEGWKIDTTKSLIQASVSTADTEVNLAENSYGDGITKVDSTKITESVNIVGNALDNSIKTGAGDDIIDGGDGNDTLTGGKGADIFVYSGGDDLITDFGTGNDTVQVDTENLKIKNGGIYEADKDVIVETNDGKLTIKDGKSKHVVIVDSNDEILYDNQDVMPKGWKADSSNKTLTATLSSAEDIDLNKGYGKGVENVDASKADSVKIVGNDNENSIKGGKGKDTISGGSGNDTVSLGAGADIYIYTGGDDVIQDYTAGTDSIQINTGDIHFIAMDTIGTNVILSTVNEKLTIQNGNNKEITVMDQNGKKVDIGVTLPAGWEYDSTHKQIKALAGYPEDLNLSEAYADGVEVIDASKAKEGVNIINTTGTSGDFSIKGSKSSDLITGGDGNDKISLGAGADTYVYTGGEDIIQDYATVDAIQISSEFTPISKNVSGSNLVFYVEMGGSTGSITVTKGNGKNITTVDENGDEISWNGVVPPPDGWKFDSSRTMLSPSVSAPDDVDLTKPYGKNVVKVDASAVSSGIEIIGNDKGNSIKGSKYDDTIISGNGNDTVSLGAGADIFVYSGGDDLVKDYKAGQDTIKVDTRNVEFKSIESVGSNMVYETSEGTFTIEGGKGKTITFIDENNVEFEPVVDPKPTVPEGWQVDTKGITFTASVKTGADNLNLTEDGFEVVEKVNGAKLTEGVEIKGNGNNNSIKGGSGADTIFGGEGNDTVSLGGGADVYVYQGGDDLIQDYKAGQDSIVLEKDIRSASISGANLIISLENGTLTVKGGKDQEVSVTDTKGKEFIIVNEYPTSESLPEGLSYNSSKTLLTASSVFGGDVIDLGNLPDSDSVEKVDASKIKTGIEIIGSDSGISIKGGSGADTIFGGTGNDTVSLGGGADIYYYNGGNDLIQDYAAADEIFIDTSSVEIVGKEISGSNVIISTDNGDLTIKNGKSKTISLYDEYGDEIWFDNDGNYVNYNSYDPNYDALTDITNAEIELGKINLAEDVQCAAPATDVLSEESSPEFSSNYSNQNK